MPHACDLEDTVREAQERLSELYKEAKAEGGSDLVRQLKTAVKIRNPEKREEFIHRLYTDQQVEEWTRGRNRAPKLEASEPEDIQASSSGLRGSGSEHAEPGEDNGEAGGEPEDETLRPLQPANSFTFLD